MRKFEDQKQDVAYLVGAQMGAPVIPVSGAILAALISIGTQCGGALQFDQLLQAQAGELGNQLSSAAANE
jgi:hypothetical protein